MAVTLSTLSNYVAYIYSQIKRDVLCCDIIKSDTHDLIDTRNFPRNKSMKCDNLKEVIVEVYTLRSDMYTDH